MALGIVGGLLLFLLSRDSAARRKNNRREHGCTSSTPKIHGHHPLHFILRPPSENVSARDICVTRAKSFNKSVQRATEKEGALSISKYTGQRGLYDTIAFSGCCRGCPLLGPAAFCSLQN